MAKRSTALILAGFLAAGLGWGGVANAASDEPSTEESVRDGLQRVLDAIELFFQNIPQYEGPEVLDNGDIIIRRKPPQADEDDKETPAATPPKLEETKT
jgi:hypothetical protein